jgi:hypothetical protein
VDGNGKNSEGEGGEKIKNTYGKVFFVYCITIGQF